MSTDLVGCATTPRDVAVAGKISDDLSCSLPTNCVTTFGNHEIAPLRFNGSAEVGLAQLRATLATFPEATITSIGDNFIEAIFTTPAGFKDVVLFQVDAIEKKINFRSRSTFGLYDFGKNKVRMVAFADRFVKQPNGVLVAPQSAAQPIR